MKQENEYNLRNSSSVEIVHGEAPDIYGLQLTTADNVQMTWWMTQERLEAVHRRVASTLNLTCRPKQPHE